MNPKYKALWIADLRSGEYEQTRANLHNDDGYCCLGVLAEAVGATWHAHPTTEKAPGSIAYYDCQIASDEDGSLLEGWFLDVVGLTTKQQEQLAAMNDGAAVGGFVYTDNRHTFPQIADWIEENL